MPARRNLQRYVINSAINGNTNFANPSATAFGYVWELYFTCAGATTVTLYDGAGALTGNINVPAGGVFLGGLPDNEIAPHFVFGPNANFSISEAGGTQKSGYVTISN